MRRINSEFKTANMSEGGHRITNRDYFGYAEMEDFACYVLADGLDEDPGENSARLVVESIIRDFTEAPVMRRGKLKRYIRRAHTTLLRQKKGMHLKASVAVAVTDYRKIRYCHVGNTRFYLIRNGRIAERTLDQSLTQNLLEKEEIPLDEAAAHEERNNLYSYLGERGTPKIRISPKKKLENGDLFTLLTRGVWERCAEQEFLAITDDAKEPEDILNQTEDAILACQEEEYIDNYTLAVTFVNKVYQSPKKRWTIKQVLLAVLPVLLLVGGLSLGLYLRHRNIREKEDALARSLESGETYLMYDNYQKAAEEYGEAKRLADSLKRREDSQEADRLKKLAEQILLADAAMAEEAYEKAQRLYLTARVMSGEAGNAGSAYIKEQLEQTLGYIEVFDLIALGERKEEYGNLKGAVAAYKEAKEKAAALYYGAGKEEAFEKQAAAEEKIEKEELEAEAREQELRELAAAEAAKQQEEEAAAQELLNQQKANDQQNAIDLENQGNELLGQGQYESAITFYQAAQAIYNRLGLSELARGIGGKIAAARAGMEAAAGAAEPDPAALNDGGVG